MEQDMPEQPDVNQNDNPTSLPQSEFLHDTSITTSAIPTIAQSSTSLTLLNTVPMDSVSIDAEDTISEEGYEITVDGSDKDESYDTIDNTKKQGKRRKRTSSEGKTKRGKKEEGILADKLKCCGRVEGFNRKLIQCDDCNGWNHLTCIKLPSSHVDQIQIFICKDCRRESGYTRATVYRAPTSQIAESAHSEGSQSKTKSTATKAQKRKKLSEDHIGEEEDNGSVFDGGDRDEPSKRTKVTDIESQTLEEGSGDMEVDSSSVPKRKAVGKPRFKQSKAKKGTIPKRAAKPGLACSRCFDRNLTCEGVIGGVCGECAAASEACSRVSTGQEEKLDEPIDEEMSTDLIENAPERGQDSMDVDQQDPLQAVTATNQESTSSNTIEELAPLRIKIPKRLMPSDREMQVDEPETHAEGSRNVDESQTNVSTQDTAAPIGCKAIATAHLDEGVVLDIAVSSRQSEGPTNGRDSTQLPTPNPTPVKVAEQTSQGSVPSQGASTSNPHHSNQPRSNEQAGLKSKPPLPKEQESNHKTPLVATFASVMNGKIYDLALQSPWLLLPVSGDEPSGSSPSCLFFHVMTKEVKDHLPPFPSHWEVQRVESESGRWRYYNKVSGEKTLDGSKVRFLPMGWKMCHSRTQGSAARPYLYSSVTKQSTRDFREVFPDLAAADKGKDRASSIPAGGASKVTLTDRPTFRVDTPIVPEGSADIEPATDRVSPSDRALTAKAKLSSANMLGLIEDSDEIMQVDEPPNLVTDTKGKVRDDKASRDLSLHLTSPSTSHQTGELDGERKTVPRRNGARCGDFCFPCRLKDLTATCDGAKPCSTCVTANRECSWNDDELRAWPIMGSPWKSEDKSGWISADLGSPPSTTWVPSLCPNSFAPLGPALSKSHRSRREKLSKELKAKNRIQSASGNTVATQSKSSQRKMVKFSLEGQEKALHGKKGSKADVNSSLKKATEIVAKSTSRTASNPASTTSPTNSRHLRFSSDDPGANPPRLPGNPGLPHKPNGAPQGNGSTFSTRQYHSPQPQATATSNSAAFAAATNPNSSQAANSTQAANAQAFQFQGQVQAAAAAMGYLTAMSQSNPFFNAMLANNMPPPATLPGSQFLPFGQTVLGNVAFGSTLPHGHLNPQMLGQQQAPSFPSHPPLAPHAMGQMPTMWPAPMLPLPNGARPGGLPIGTSSHAIPTPSTSASPQPASAGIRAPMAKPTVFKYDSLK